MFISNGVHHRIQHFIFGWNGVCTIFFSVHFYDTRPRKSLMRLLHHLLNCWHFCHRNVCISLNQFINDETDMYLQPIFYISHPLVDISQLFLLQHLSIQQLRLFTWYRAVITSQMKVLLQEMMRTWTNMKSLMQQHTRMTWNVRLFTWCKLINYWISSQAKVRNVFLVQSSCKWS